MVVGFGRVRPFKNRRTEKTERRCHFTPSVLPDIVVLLNVNLVKHHVLLLGVYVRFHLHGDVARQHREQEAFLQRGKRGESMGKRRHVPTRRKRRNAEEEIISKGFTRNLRPLSPAAGFLSASGGGPGCIPWSPGRPASGSPQRGNECTLPRCWCRRRSAHSTRSGEGTAGQCWNKRPKKRQTFAKGRVMVFLCVITINPLKSILEKGSLCV